MSPCCLKPPNPQPCKYKFWSLLPHPRLHPQCHPSKHKSVQKFQMWRALRRDLLCKWNLADWCSPAFHSMHGSMLISPSEEVQNLASQSEQYWSKPGRSILHEVTYTKCWCQSGCQWMTAKLSRTIDQYHLHISPINIISGPYPSIKHLKRWSAPIHLDHLPHLQWAPEMPPTEVPGMHQRRRSTDLWRQWESKVQPPGGRMPKDDPCGGAHDCDAGNCWYKWPRCQALKGPMWTETLHKHQGSALVMVMCCPFGSQLLQKVVVSPAALAHCEALSSRMASR